MKLRLFSVVVASLSSLLLISGCGSSGTSSGDAAQAGTNASGSGVGGSDASAGTQPAAGSSSTDGGRSELGGSAGGPSSGAGIGGGGASGDASGGSSGGTSSGGTSSGGTSSGGTSSGGSSGGTSSGGTSSGGTSGGVSGAGGFGQAGSSGSGGIGGGTPNGVEQWHPSDIVLGGTTSAEVTDTLSATFTGPGGRTVIVPGFFDGAAGWKIRFAPTAVGAWSYTTTSTVPALSGKKGTVACVANSNPRVHGRLIVDAAHPHSFKYEDGTPYLMMGFEADWLALMDFGDAAIPKATSLIDIYANRGFNQVMMEVFAYDTTWKSGTTSAVDFGPPSQYPWKGTNDAPDHSHMNPTFFANYDRVMQALLDRGVIAHVFFKVYSKGVNWPTEGSPEDDLYFRYVSARYQAFPNVLWDFAKESNHETDVTYKTGRIKLIHALDGYHHLVTTHTDSAYYASTASKGLLDFRTDQARTSPYDRLSTLRNAESWPEINAEFDYEIGNDGGKTYGIASDKVKVLKGALEVVMAGGYIVYYYTYHAWDVVRSAEVPNGLVYYKNMNGVLSSTNWPELEPADGLIDSATVGRHCLAKEGAEYLLYLDTGNTSLNVANIPAGKTLKGKWVNLVSGQEQAIAAVGNGPVLLTNPWSVPALAHLAP